MRTPTLHFPYKKRQNHSPFARSSLQAGSCVEAGAALILRAFIQAHLCRCAGEANQPTSSLRCGKHPPMRRSPPIRTTSSASQSHGCPGGCDTWRREEAASSTVCTPIPRGRCSHPPQSPIPSPARLRDVQGGASQSQVIRVKSVSTPPPIRNSGQTGGLVVWASCMPLSLHTLFFACTMHKALGSCRALH